MPSPDAQLNLFDSPPQKRRKTTPRPIKGGKDADLCERCGKEPFYYDIEPGRFCLDCGIKLGY